MRFTSIGNEKGEVMMGVMVVMMAVMMLFGMPMRHGEHRSDGDHRQPEQTQVRDKDGAQHKDDHATAQDPVPGPEGPGNQLAALKRARSD